MEKRTSKPEYVPYLLGSLRELGSATEDTLLDRAFTSVRDSLHPADFTVLVNGEPRWRFQMQHMLDGLIESGIIAKRDGLLIIRED